MEYIEVDARGLSCPIPVMKTTKVIKKEQGSFKVLIDDETSFENVMRTLENFKLEIEKTKSVTVHPCKYRINNLLIIQTYPHGSFTTS